MNKLSNKINYQLGQLYTSKEDLFKDFFTDFYNYLEEYYPESITDYPLNDFLHIANDWEYGKGTMYGLGDLFKDYFLVEVTGGSLETQTDKGFIGYCYKNNKHVSFIKFMMTFFAYWRTDEAYSTIDNHGNDFFHSGWASLVDTCKFFYLNPKTLFHYQRTERLLSCFEDIDSVVNIEGLPLEVDNISLPSLERRGHTFVGWFTDKELKNQITTLSKSMTNVNLYPKWEKETYKISYLDEDNNVTKEEECKYLDYIDVLEGYIYIDIVENTETKRILYYTKEMPIINDIIFSK